ncbi:MAG: VOC family protein, partial [Planctomycetes bacterium]|nr:VOC family protein [Planctomycetota bacterium]
MAARKSSKKSARKGTAKKSKTTKAKAAPKAAARKKAPGKKGTVKKAMPRAAAKRPAAKKSAKKSAKKAASRRAKAAPAPAAPAMPAWAWHEVMTNDVATAQAFYTHVFGWTARDSGMPGMTYTLFAKDGVDVGGCMALPEHEGQPACAPQWVAYVQVDDVDAAVERSTSKGGSVDMPAMDIPGVGRVCILRDPAG